MADQNYSAVKSTVKSGIGFGSALAITISWSVNKSVFWAILHGLFSWLYVLYYLLDSNGWIGIATK
ncbi:MAG: hypothetical protein L6Q77_11220 [Bacteroidetes bacterium]|nr:hypothetical protein [Bacteroidota bacterium]